MSLLLQDPAPAGLPGTEKAPECNCQGTRYVPSRVIQSDVDINTSDTSTPTHNQISGPITRAHARQLNNQVSSFIASYSSYLDNRNMCSILLLRNDGQERNRVAFAPTAFGFQNSTSL
jgi:hypothetical protein